MQDRGLAAYIAELLGTLLLVFFITSVVVLYVSTGQNAQFGSDFAVVGLVHFLVLFALIISIGVASGGHFNPAVTAASSSFAGSTRSTASSTSSPSSRVACSARCSRRPSCSTRDAPRTTARRRSAPLLGGAFQGSMVEGIGAFVLVLAVLAVALNPEIRRWAALATGGALGLAGHGARAADRRFVQPGPLVRSRARRQPLRRRVGLHPRPDRRGLLAAAVYRFIIEPTSGPVQEMADTVAPRGPAPPAGEAPPLRQSQRPGRWTSAVLASGRHRGFVATQAW